MHPKEFRKTKNGTGHFTNLSLPNSKIFIGIDFSNHDEVNEIINNPKNSCYLLYPSNDSIKLNTQNIKEENKTNIIFILDSTWPCANKMLRVSTNLQKLKKLSFEHTKASDFQFKTQPKEYCLSTMESTLCVLELLNFHGVENIKEKQFDSFLKPFEKMVEYQVNCSDYEQIRYKPRFKKSFLLNN
jgi:DTW domain-containing protein YfiP